VVRVLAPGGRCLLSALHPDRTAEGQRARYIDPETGLRRPIRTFHRTAADYRAAAEDAGLVLTGERVLTVSPGLAERFPRARPYIGRALGWVAGWTKRGFTAEGAEGAERKTEEGKDMRGEGSDQCKNAVS
jgi:hypothetical protein